MQPDSSCSTDLIDTFWDPFTVIPSNPLGSWLKSIISTGFTGT